MYVWTVVDTADLITNVFVYVRTMWCSTSKYSRLSHMENAVKTPDHSMRVQRVFVWLEDAGA